MSVTINGRRATIEEQKQLAIEMWEFVRICQTDLCTAHSSMDLKRKFCNMKLKLGIDIEWDEDCFLCNYYTSCNDCPLFKNTDYHCVDGGSPYDITMNPDDYHYYEVDEAIDKIIEAIKEF